MPENPTTANLPVFGLGTLARSNVPSKTRIPMFGYAAKFPALNAPAPVISMTLKDDSSVIDGVCWRGVAGRLSIQPEDGLEVIVTGKLTTYAARSKYQLVIESMELAGEGASSNYLKNAARNWRRKASSTKAEKRPLPFLPEVIGVVTSDRRGHSRYSAPPRRRFPRHVLLWPVLVQGETAADQVAAAIGVLTRSNPAAPSIRTC